MQFEDRNILITGGSGALGRRVVERIEREGGRVTIVARAPVAGHQTLRLTLQSRQRGRLLAQDDAQRSLEVDAQKAQHVAPRQPDLKCREIEPSEILVAPAARRLRTRLRPVQVDQREAKILGTRRGIEVEKKVTDVKIAVIDPAAVHAPGHLGNAPDQRALPCRQRRILRPIAAMVFEADRACQLFGNDEGMLPRGIDTALSKGHRRHAGDE